MPKAVVKNYGRNKKGKLVVTSKSVTKGVGADVNTAMAARGQAQTKTKGQLMSQAEQNRHAEKMAQITNKAATIQSAIGQGALTLNRAFNSMKPVQTNITNTTPTSVQNLVNGGADQASNSRDEDEEDEDGYANIA